MEFEMVETLKSLEKVITPIQEAQEALVSKGMWYGGSFSLRFNSFSLFN